MLIIPGIGSSIPVPFFIPIKMNRKKIIRIVLSIFLSISFIGILLWISKTSLYQNNNFQRVFPPRFLSDWKVTDIEASFNKIVGISPNTVYLGNTTNPTYFKEVNYKTGEQKKQQLNIPQDSPIAWKALQMHIDSQNIYLTEGITPTILSGDLNNLDLTRKTIDSIHFSKCLPVSPSFYILTAYAPTTRQNILIKETLNPISIERIPNIPEKQVDGIFCTDGDLHYNKEKKALIYVYRYRNEFLYMDMDLNINYKGKTIDTISRAKIEVTQTGTDGKKQFILSAPPLVVNKKSAVSGSRLFIHSALLSENENKQEFFRKSVIDIYTLNNARYLFSFYIPAYQGGKMRSFAIHNNTLIVLYNSHLLTFTMNLPDGGSPG